MLPSHAAPWRRDAGAAARRGCCGRPQRAASSQMDFQQVSNDVSRKTLSYINDTSGWKVIKAGKLVTVSVKPSTDYRGNIYRVEATMEQPAEKVFPFLYLPEYRTKWDKSLQSYRIIETIDKLIFLRMPWQRQHFLKSQISNYEAVQIPDSMDMVRKQLYDHFNEETAVYHSITHSYGLGLVPPRDFVYLVHIKKYDDLLTTNSTSVEHPKCPPCSSYVRGQTYPSCYACYPLPGNPKHCMLVVIIQVDLGGLLLPSVIQSVMPANLMNLIIDFKAGIKKLQ